MSYSSTIYLSKGVFGRVDFREDEKKKKKKGENEERKLFGECLVKRGREENNSGVHVFSLRAHKKVFSSKWRENLVGRV